MLFSGLDNRLIAVVSRVQIFLGYADKIPKSSRQLYTSAWIFHLFNLPFIYCTTFLKVAKPVHNQAFFIVVNHDFKYTQEKSGHRPVSGRVVVARRGKVHGFQRKP